MIPESIAKYLHREGVEIDHPLTDYDKSIISKLGYENNAQFIKTYRAEKKEYLRKGLNDIFGMEYRRKPGA